MKLNPKNFINRLRLFPGQEPGVKSRLSTCLVGLVWMLLPMALRASVTPYPPYPGAVASDSYRVTVNGQPVFVHKFFTFDQFQWMDYASFGMTEKVHVEVTCLVSERKLMTCHIRPLAYGIEPKINGNTVSFDLDQPRYLVMFFNDEPLFNNGGLLLFAEPPEKDPPKLGDPNVVNIQDYKVDSTGKTLETTNINRAISDVSARPGGGVLFFPPGVYLSGAVLMKSNVTLYVDAGALIRGSRKAEDYTTPPAASGGRLTRAFFVFNNVENAGLRGRGAIDMEGYPWLWHDFQPDTSDGRARDANGKVNDPRNGIRGYVVNNSRNVSFQDLLLLRSAYWTVTVSGSQNFSTHHLKILNRKQQYHDDAYDFTSGSSHILIEDGFAMTMDDTWAFYGGGKGRSIEDFVVKGFVNYSYTCSLAMGYGGAPPVKHLRLEDAHFVANHNKFAIWIQLTPAYFTGRGYSAGARPSHSAALDDFRFVNCTFENDGGHIYIDGGEAPLTDFVFENCVFDRPYKPDKITGTNVSSILFKNVTMNGAVVRNVEDLARAGLDISVPAKFEP
ncbi:MAG: glycosyl hydrolase family 28-related protein [Limisphaerales bacterium]